MNKEIITLIKEPKYIISPIFIKVFKKLKLNTNEIFLIVYFYNQDISLFDIEKIEKKLFMDKNEILDTFNSLLGKNLITLDTIKDKDNKILEVVNIDNFLNEIEKDLKEDLNSKNEEDIYQKFENELGRTLSPMEFEIINGWLTTNISKELIIGALKEAVYNGVSSFRYIDKIIYEWNKKGFKNMEDVNNHLVKKDEKNQEDLFDYDWLNDEE